MIYFCMTCLVFIIKDIFDDVNDTLWIWNQLTMQVVNEHAKIKTKTVTGQRAPYMNGELRRAINVRNMLKRKYTRVKTAANWNSYRKQRNLVTRLHKIV